jgi:hypothetical protein
LHESAINLIKSNNLKKIKLTSIDLTTLPIDLFDNLKNLEELDISECSGLVSGNGELHPVIIKLIKDNPNLKIINLSGLRNLKTLPPNFKDLKNLEELDLSLCTTLSALPEMPNSLKKLDLGYIEGLQELSTSLRDLEEINISGCINLSKGDKKELDKLVEETVKNNPRCKITLVNWRKILSRSYNKTPSTHSQ